MGLDGKEGIVKNMFVSSTSFMVTEGKRRLDKSKQNALNRKQQQQQKDSFLSTGKKVMYNSCHSFKVISTEGPNHKKHNAHNNKKIGFLIPM